MELIQDFGCNYRKNGVAHIELNFRHNKLFVKETDNIIKVPEDIRAIQEIN